MTTRAFQGTKSSLNKKRVEWVLAKKLSSNSCVGAREKQLAFFLPCRLRLVTTGGNLSSFFIFVWCVYVPSVQQFVFLCMNCN